ncbi:MAG: ubiquitin-conjugating enzyme E2 [Candidatus Hodarchaeales archaeon]
MTHDLHSTRLRAEFKAMLRTYPPSDEEQISWQLKERDLARYELRIHGRKGTPYAGGIWKITIDLPPEYPFKPPIVNFRVPIWHPNIAIGDMRWKWGSNVCLSLVNWNNQGKPGGWKETITLPSVVEHIEMMLDVFPGDGEFPEYLVDPKDPFNKDAGEQMLNDFHAFYQTAENWTRKHALKMEDED